MKERELSLATSKVADIKIVSGRATDNEINCCLRTGKEGSFGRIASLAILRSLIAAGFVVALAPMPAQADEEERGRDKKIEALEAKVESLQATVSALESQVSTLQAGNTTLQNQLANAKNVLALDPFVSVDPNPEIGVNGPNITFKGANIHIVSGSGMTNDNLAPTGLGNLIIGYDDDPRHLFGGVPLNPGDRGGSHNLVIGDGNRFTQFAFGGLVAGTLNTISSYAASVLGGSGNTASNLGATVSGGFRNTAEGDDSSVLGGIGNAAAGGATVVIGGQNNVASTQFSIAPQPPFP